MSWMFIVVAGLFEIAWAIGLKYSNGFTKPIPSLFTVVTLAISMVLLAKGAKNLPIGTAYAVWTGIGAVGTALLGVYLFEEPITSLRLLFITLIIAGIVGLHTVSSASHV